jgi:hypothetical protein
MGLNDKEEQDRRAFLNQLLKIMNTQLRDTALALSDILSGRTKWNSNFEIFELSIRRHPLIIYIIIIIILYYYYYLLLTLVAVSGITSSLRCCSQRSPLPPARRRLPPRASGHRRPPLSPILR